MEPEELMRLAMDAITHLRDGLIAREWSERGAEDAAIALWNTQMMLEKK